MFKFAALWFVVLCSCSMEGESEIEVDANEEAPSQELPTLEVRPFDDSASAHEITLMLDDAKLRVSDKRTVIDMATELVIFVSTESADMGSEVSAYSIRVSAGVFVAAKVVATESGCDLYLSTVGPMASSEEVVELLSTCLASIRGE